MAIDLGLLGRPTGEEGEINGAVWTGDGSRPRAE